MRIEGFVAVGCAADSSIAAKPFFVHRMRFTISVMPAESSVSQSWRANTKNRSGFFIVSLIRLVPLAYVTPLGSM